MRPIGASQARQIILVLAAACAVATAAAAAGGDTLGCSACKAVAAELSQRLAAESAARATVDARNRLDKDGKRYGKVTDYKISELRAVELLDGLCSPSFAAGWRLDEAARRWVRDAGGASEAAKAQRKLLQTFCGGLVEDVEDALAGAVRAGRLGGAAAGAGRAAAELLCRELSGHCRGDGAGWDDGGGAGGAAGAPPPPGGGRAEL